MFAPLILSADSKSNLPVNWHVSCPVALRDGRRVVGDARLQQPVLRRAVMDTAAKMICVTLLCGDSGTAVLGRDQELVEVAPVFPANGAK